ncbi:MAG: hypothetical protein LUG56_05490 [Lachnospiraceae bacterium]|nr:hypothetical protein [Lachnospiraceae bacterium]MCD7841907.1 hypothetical protein [Lachnospiraceae bacterium]
MNAENHFGAESRNRRKNTTKKEIVGTSRTLRIVCYFGGRCLQMIGYALLVTVIWDLFVPIVRGEAGGGWPLSWKMAAALLEDFPPYLLLAGGVIVWICPTVLFNNIIATMISMNVTRRLTALSMWLCEGVVILAVFGTAGLFSVFGVGTFWMEWLPLIFAAETFAALIGIYFGMVSIRNRTLGMIFNAVFAGGFAFFCGLMAGLEGEASIFNQNVLKWMRSPLMPVIGLALYAAAGAVSLRGLRKIEVRR